MRERRSVKDHQVDDDTRCFGRVQQTLTNSVFKQPRLAEHGP